MNALLADAAGVTQSVARSAKTLDNFPLIPQNQKIDWTSAASYILISALILNMSITHIQKQNDILSLSELCRAAWWYGYSRNSVPRQRTKRSLVAENFLAKPSRAIKEWSDYRMAGFDYAVCSFPAGWCCLVCRFLERSQNTAERNSRVQSAVLKTATVLILMKSKLVVKKQPNHVW